MLLSNRIELVRLSQLSQLYQRINIEKHQPIDTLSALKYQRLSISPKIFRYRAYGTRYKAIKDYPSHRTARTPHRVPPYTARLVADPDVSGGYLPFISPLKKYSQAGITFAVKPSFLNWSDWLKVIINPSLELKNLRASKRPSISLSMFSPSSM